MRNLVIVIGVTLVVIGVAVYFVAKDHDERVENSGAADAGAKAPYRSLLDNRPDTVDPSRKPPHENLPRTTTTARVKNDVPPAGVGDKKNPALEGLGFDVVDSAAITALGVSKERTGGLLVKSVDPASSAQEAAIRTGDIITRADRTLVIDEESLKRAIGDRDHTVIELFRGGKPYYVVLHKPFVAGDK